MPYRFKRGEEFGDGVRRIAKEEIDKAIAEIDDVSLDRQEAVHQVRKRCKMIRGLLRLARGAYASDDTYGVENAWYRDAARRLSGLRDAEAMIECYDRLMDHYAGQVDRRSLASIRRRLVSRLKSQGAQDVDERLKGFRKAMTEGRERVSLWKFHAADFDAIESGLVRTYKRGRKGLATAYAEATDEAFHEWRKRIKYHWYHMRLLCGAWKPALAARRDLVDQLASTLGEDHDLAVMRQTLCHSANEFRNTPTRRKLLGLVDRRRAELHAGAQPLGERLFAESPKAFGKRLRVYWKTWRAGKGMRKAP